MFLPPGERRGRYKLLRGERREAGVFPALFRSLWLRLYDGGEGHATKPSFPHDGGYFVQRMDEISGPRRAQPRFRNAATGDGDADKALLMRAISISSTESPTMSVSAGRRLPAAIYRRKVFTP